MIGYAKRRTLLEPPSEDQRKFLETLRDLGPRDNAQTAAVRKSTKRACQVRGWVEWRCLDDLSGLRVWHLTIIGRNALNSETQEEIAARAEVDERLLLFCVASGTDWARAGIKGMLVRKMIGKDLIKHDGKRLALTARGHVALQALLAGAGIKLTSLN
jgi:hypothetical protein